MTPLAQETLESFQRCNSWEQRSRLVLQAAHLLPEFPVAYKNDQHLVPGCTAKVWLKIDASKPHLNCFIDSEARLLKGLLALMHVRINGLNQTELEQVDVNAWFEHLGLSKQLTPSRANGLHTVFQQILSNCSA